MSKDNDL